jgi:hypothetical protein
MGSVSSTCQEFVLPRLKKNEGRNLTLARQCISILSFKVIPTVSRISRTKLHRPAGAVLVNSRWGVAARKPTPTLMLRC